MRERPRVCVVDAISSGALIAPALRRRGFDSVHVASHPWTESDREGFIAKDHAASIEFDGDLDRCAAELAAHRPLCIVAGTDPGAQLADRLAERLGLPTNGTALSACRRDKFEMQHRLDARGVRCIKTGVATEWPAAAALIEAHGAWPMVLKPPLSAASDNVHIVRDLAAARAAFDSILASTNSFGMANPAAVIQEYIHGTEFILDAAVCAGHPYVATLWRLQKQRGDTPVYDYGEVVSPNVSPHAEIVAYAWEVLDALGLRFGAAHMELMLTETGPVLIEMGARLGGQQTPVPIEAGRGVSQIDAMLDAFLAPEQFFLRARAPALEPPPYIRRVELICPKQGLLCGLPRLDAVRALPSFFQLHMYAVVGEPIARTVDFLVPGYVDLIAGTAAALDADYRQIRAWEADDFYQIEA